MSPFPIRLPSSLWLLLALLSLTASASGSLRQLHGETMGTSYSIRWQQSTPHQGPAEVLHQVERQLQRVNRTLSVFRDDAEVVALNDSPVGQPIQVSEETARVLTIARRIARESGGALDITLGPVIEFWGFGAKPRDLSHKSLGQLELVRSRTGMGGFRLEGRQFTKLIPGLEINPSAVAKGYGVDLIAEALTAMGIGDYLVEVGGELRSQGSAPRGGPWQVAVTRPEKLSLEFQQRVPLDNLAMATSGNYVNLIRAQGVSLGHIIDPRTGYPAASGTLSVTVLHPSCAEADGYATAMMVLTPDQALALARDLDLAVMVVQAGPTGPVSRFSPAFRRIVAGH
ncbi:FAD:protein FMN transferase [Ferrimonas sediminicola]|uniref:FAD:protein FMN transferase n=1 Tax=Ferrimonas sediminicola TaxID=2569538 RepID=A0A4U1BD91_9GAMM|nr:FAD:protein FMN transferase [Ferrimonas sediminicola]TKB48702.1 FAD:protein FMN transferase [Ferrimonas sediminicola]